MGIIIIILTVLSAILSCLLGFSFFSNDKMKELYTCYVFYILIANLILWVLAIIKARKQTKSFYCETASYLKKHKWAVIFAFLLTICGLFASKPDFRILADETNLLSMSQAFYENRECKNITSATYYYYGFKSIISWDVDKRPALFPLFECFFHSIFGYRPENAFGVNAIACFLSLIILYNLVTSQFGRFYGKCSMLLLSAYPLWVLYYTSAGFEVFNLLFSLILFWYLAKFIKEPNAVNTEVLLLLLPLISQTRYESAISVFCVLPAVFLMLPKEEYLKFSYKLVIFPLLLVPVAWLRLLTDNPTGLQMDEVGKKAFAWEHFVDNTKKALEFFTGQDLAYGIIPLVTYFAAFGCAWAFISFVIKAVKKKITYKQSVFWSVIIVFYLFHAIIRFAYYWGNLTYRFNSRLGIIFLPLIVYFAIYSFYNLWQELRLKKVFAAIIAVILLLVYWPVAGMNLGVRDLTLYREFRSVREYLEKHFPNKNEYILVADRANMYVPLKYSTISFNHFNNNVSNYKNSLSNRTYNYIIFVQTVNKATGKAISNCSIPMHIKMENLYETQIRADQYIRVSKYDLSMDKTIIDMK